MEQLAKGAKNTTKGSVTFTPTEYTVKRYQQTFTYNDMEVMQDPYILDVATNGASVLMANQIKTEYFAELAKIGNTFEYDTTFNYATVVDALAQIDKEVETDMFIIMGNDLKAAIRKDTDFIASKQDEQKKKLKKRAKRFSAPPWKFFVKKDGSVEQDRDVETKENTVVYERHGVIALVDDTYSLKITKKTSKG